MPLELVWRDGAAVGVRGLSRRNAENAIDFVCKLPTRRLRFVKDLEDGAAELFSNRVRPDEPEAYSASLWVPNLNGIPGLREMGGANGTEPGAAINAALINALATT